MRAPVGEPLHSIPPLIETGADKGSAALSEGLNLSSKRWLTCLPIGQ